MGFLYGQKLFEVRSNQTSRKSVHVFPILVMISNPNFLDYSPVLLEYCLIIPSISFWYQRMLDGPTVGDILLGINNPTRSHSSAPWKEPMAISKFSLIFSLVHNLLSQQTIVSHICTVSSISTMRILVNFLPNSIGFVRFFF